MYNETREILIDRVYQKVSQVYRFRNYTQKDVARVVKWLESSIYEQMTLGKAIYIKGIGSIYPDPGSIALIKKRRMRHRYLRKIEHQSNQEQTPG